MRRCEDLGDSEECVKAARLVDADVILTTAGSVRVATAGLFDPTVEERESAETFSIVRYDRI